METYGDKEKERQRVCVCVCAQEKKKKKGSIVCDRNYLIKKPQCLTILSGSGQKQCSREADCLTH